MQATNTYGIELNQAWRGILRTPGFAFSVILLMAISAGGMAAITSAGWALFVQPLPFVDADRLVTLSAYSRRFGVDMGYSELLAEELNTSGDYGRIGLAGAPKRVDLLAGGTLTAAAVDHRVMQILGLHAQLGRLFTQDDVQPGATAVALVSHGLWKSRFNSSTKVIGKLLDLDTGAVRIIGVLPESTEFPQRNVQLWLPMQLGPDKLAPEMIGNLGSLLWVARPPLHENMEVYQQRLQAKIEGDERMLMVSEMLKATFRMRPLREYWSGGLNQTISTLTIATIVVMIAAWFNLAGLWLARWCGRDQAMSIQLALGSGRGRLLLIFLFEYLLLLLPAIFLSMLVAHGAINLLYKLEVLRDSGPLQVNVSVPALLAIFLTAVIGVIMIGSMLSSRLQRLRHGPARELTVKGVTAIGGNIKVQKILLVGQISMVCTLLITLFLLLFSWRNLLQEELGFDKNDLLVAQIKTTTPREYGPDPVLTAVLERLSAMPGIAAVSWSDVLPFSQIEVMSSVRLERSKEQLPVRPRNVGPDFFSAAGISLLSGRAFIPEDVGHGLTNVIVDQSFADMYIDGEALGKKIALSSGADSFVEHNVVGVVEAVRHMRPDESLHNPTVYMPAKTPLENSQLLLRTAMQPERLVQSVRKLLEHELGKDRIGFVASMKSMVRMTQRDRVPQIVLVALFAGLSVLLLVYGLYALVSFQVNQRAMEIGLRKALGANRNRILLDEILRSARLLPTGIFLGGIGGYCSQRLIQNQLYHATLIDPTLWVLIIGAIICTVFVASVLPAVRAAALSPADKLFSE
ncbi:MAG: ABC transporter permease [Gammaproteobacteria bacterium]|nr:ABC transporter permease [Gammaproteobacteria bacterium]